MPGCLCLDDLRLVVAGGGDPHRGGTADGRWIVVGGRRWRAADPELPDQVRARLQHHLGTARSAVRTAKRAGDDAAVAAARARVGVAKRGLGERGTPWWEQDFDARRERWTTALQELDPS